ncbi:MAG: hypothetical protein ACO3I4_06365, partial [Candidatus Kapaibacteriota bacterium]
TVLYSALSATAWNALLLWAGMALGSQWQRIDYWLSVYGWVLLGLTIVIVVLLVLRKRRTP